MLNSGKIITLYSTECVSVSELSCTWPDLTRRGLPGSSEGRAHRHCGTGGVHKSWAAQLALLDVACLTEAGCYVTRRDCAGSVLRIRASQPTQRPACIEDPSIDVHVLQAVLWVSIMGPHMKQCTAACTITPAVVARTEAVRCGMHIAPPPPRPPCLLMLTWPRGISEAEYFTTVTGLSSAHHRRHT